MTINIKVRVRASCRVSAGEMDDEGLVEAVRSFPCLWEVTCKTYKDARAKENAWKQVASQVSISL